MTTTAPAAAVDRLAGALTTPPVGPVPSGWAQSLDKGAPGIVLLHIERARTGDAGWRPVRDWLSTITRQPLAAGPHAGLYDGLPAAAYAVHHVETTTGAHPRALAAINQALARVVSDRLDRAHARIDRGDLPDTHEFDLISGLTGLGALLLHHHVDHPQLPDVLTYLVRLTEPIPGHGQQLPGWWTPLSPNARVADEFPDGHANLGIAHGITGPLALLALAARAGITVPGQQTALDYIGQWLLEWRQACGRGVWWPQWLTLDQHRQPHTRQTVAGRPSWCYGTPGIGRALQLAGIALADPHMRCVAETAMADCLTNPDQLNQITDNGLCHGTAGLLHTAARIAHDATATAIRQSLTRIAEPLLKRQPDAEASGLLNGDAGIALALHTLHHPSSRWDACLLLT